MSNCVLHFKYISDIQIGKSDFYNFVTKTFYITFIMKQPLEDMGLQACKLV